MSKFTPATIFVGDIDLNEVERQFVAFIWTRTRDEWTNFDHSRFTPADHTKYKVLAKMCCVIGNGIDRHPCFWPEAEQGDDLANLQPVSICGVTLPEAYAYQFYRRLQ